MGWGLWHNASWEVPLPPCCHPTLIMITTLPMITTWTVHLCKDMPPMQGHPPHSTNPHSPLADIIIRGAPGTPGLTLLWHVPCKAPHSLTKPTHHDSMTDTMITTWPGHQSDHVKLPSHSPNPHSPLLPCTTTSAGCGSISLQIAPPHPSCWKDPLSLTACSE
jgi:hypothetical protein